MAHGIYFYCKAIQQLSRGIDRGQNNTETVMTVMDDVACRLNILLYYSTVNNNTDNHSKSMVGSLKALKLL